jgi:ribosomal protein L37E
MSKDDEDITVTWLVFCTKYEPRSDEWFRAARSQANMLLNDEPAILCPACGIVSYHCGDIDTGYCSNCHEFTQGMTRP